MTDVRALAVLLASVCIGCQAPPRNDRAQAQQRVDTATAAKPAPVVRSVPRESGREPGGAAKTESPETGDSNRIWTAAEVLVATGINGRQLSVRGNCFGYGSITALGAPPVTRSDWALGDSIPQIYVVGAPPTGCGDVGVPRGGVPVTLSAVVAQDTVPGVLGRPSRVRRFLRRVELRKP